jgi:hypothetical protein
MAGAVGPAAPSRSASAANLQIAYLPPEHLRPSSNNARRHSKKLLKQIARSIERFGFVNPVLISDGFEIISQQRPRARRSYLAWRKLGCRRLHGPLSDFRAAGGRTPRFNHLKEYFTLSVTAGGFWPGPLHSSNRSLETRSTTGQASLKAYFTDCRIGPPASKVRF